MGAINPPGYLHNVSTHTALIDRLSSAGGLLLPAPGAATELRGKGGLRIPSDCQVTAQATPNMTVNLSAGIAYVPQAQSAIGGTYTVPNDAVTVLTISAANATLPRNDLIVARVYDQFYAGTQNLAAFEVITGTAASTPVDPALPTGSSYLVLARVVVPANATTITNANITNIPEMAQLAGSIKKVGSANTDAGLYDGQYRDHPTLGLQRWNATGSTWGPPGLDTGWLAFGPGDMGSGFGLGSEGIKYRKINGSVYLNLHASRDTGSRTGFIVNLPAAYRPSILHWFNAITGGILLGELQIRPNGDVWLQNSPGSAATGFVCTAGWPAL